jgi:hypothetical protein
VERTRPLAGAVDTTGEESAMGDEFIVAGDDPPDLGDFSTPPTPRRPPLVLSRRLFDDEDDDACDDGWGDDDCDACCLLVRRPNDGIIR